MAPAPKKVLSLLNGDIAELFDSMTKQKFQKRGDFIFRPAAVNFHNIPETVLTIVAGKLETLKTATIGEMIVRNIMIGSSAETYIIPEDTFRKR